MGIKSTIHLTRSEAENKFLELSFEVYKTEITSILSSMTNSQLEDLLEIMNDDRCKSYGWESGFDNYIVEDNKSNEN